MNPLLLFILVPAALIGMSFYDYAQCRKITKAGAEYKEAHKFKFYTFATMSVIFMAAGLFIVFSFFFKF